MSGKFELDPERLPQAIADLKEARDQIIELQEMARDLAGEVANAGSDGVSSNAGVQLASVAGGPDPGSLATANAAYLEAVEAAIESFEAMLAEYHNVEDANQLGLGNIDAAQFTASETPSERRQREYYENSPHLPPGAAG
ncbi:hypothetical protein [Actinoalloteichus hymeniacidonis]|uniref:PE domain-containing protein n=1 Tax=Actinoalloteichus hymeniacidonis TaxID=340345 RepID=A0AAC9HKK4_9PSEU|nr:hypothetical protein [Actinoalloteichus hymeniacidonis]AOS61122.1 hypothetical protein TL08_01405 [Actinoalloteichus hymeniacidonis]MBB5910877.1 hypothetical protein [Actinoalloteichus hymeniacidonis]